MVVCNPGDWFDEVLEGLAEQDYANLKSLFLVVGEPGDVPERVRQRVPNAFVRGVGGSTGVWRGSQRGPPPGRGHQRLLLLLARRRRPRSRRDPPAGRGAVSLERRHRRPEAGVMGRSGRAAARRHRRRPIRRGRFVRRGGRGRPGAARCRPRRVRTSFCVPDGACRPVQGDRRFRHLDGLLRRRRRPVLARPPRRSPRRGRAGSAGPSPRGVVRASTRFAPGVAAGTTSHAVGRHADRRTTSATAVGAADLRDARRARRRRALGQAARSVGIGAGDVRPRSATAWHLRATPRRSSPAPSSRRRDRRVAAAWLGPCLCVPAQPRHATVAGRELDRAPLASDRWLCADVRLDLCAPRPALRQPASARRHPSIRRVPAASCQPSGHADRLPLRMVGSWPGLDGAGTDGRGTDGVREHGDAVPHGPAAHRRRARPAGGRLPRDLASRHPVPDGAGADRGPGGVCGGAAAVATAVEWSLGSVGLLRSGTVDRAPVTSQRRHRVVRHLRQHAARRPTHRSRHEHACGCCVSSRC